MATLSQLEVALINADKAGDADAARRLAKIVSQERARRTSNPNITITEQIPDFGEEEVPGTTAPTPEPTLGEKLAGAGETGLAMLTGATGGLAGQIEGTVEGILKEVVTGEFGSYEAADRIEKLAMERAQALTYAPRTETGQEFTQETGEALAPLAAIPPLAETQMLANVASRVPARAIANQRVVQPAVQQAQRTQELAKQISQQVRERLPGLRRADDTTPGTGTSAGAQAVDKAVLRQAEADELPVPIKLTEGQKTRDFEAQRFERETAKLPEEGAPIRERFEEQNLQLQQNLDEFIDATGAELTDLRGVGELVDRALRNRAARDKIKIRTLYKEAEKAGEMENIVDTSALIKSLNDLKAVESTAPVISAVKKELVRLGGAIKDADGTLLKKQPKSPTQPLKYLTKDDIDTLSDTSREDLFKFIKKVEKALDETDDAEIAWDLIDELSYDNQIRLPESFTVDTMVNKDTGAFSSLRLSEDTVNKLNEWFSQTRKTALKNALGETTDKIRRETARSRGEFPGTDRFDPTSYKELAKDLPEPEGISLNNMEQLRKFINKVAGNDPTNIKFASDLKRIIDQSTEGMGGGKYKQARSARAKYAREYESLSLPRRLLGTKRGSDDRAIALEDVVRKAVMDPSTSLDEMRQIRRLLQTKSGAEGKQAWKELQGATLRHIQEQMLKGVTTNQRGDQIVSPAQLDRVISTLDKSGKLDFVFGKRGAEQLRTISGVAKTVLTSPPGTVNTSNTATVLAGLMDVALTGFTGIPAPVATSFKLLTGKIKDAKLKARIKKTLGE